MKRAWIYLKPAEPNSTDLDESFSFIESLSQDKTFQEATLIATLSETFGLTKFKPFRKEIIKATLDGKDTIVIHQTGSGKSFPISTSISAKESYCYFTQHILNAGSSNKFDKQRN